MATMVESTNLAKMLEVLATADPVKLQAVLGSRAVGESAKPHLQRGFTFISARERQWYSPDLIKFAEHVCPQWSQEGFRPSKWLNSVMESVRGLREAIPETALAFLLRKGVQTLANDWYITVPREWQDYAATTGSDGVAEWYGPLYGSTVAGLVPRGERFPEGKVIGNDVVLVNYKFGLIESFDRELFDDDQTGQIRQRAQKLGASMAITENAYAALRFIGAQATYANLLVPATNYTTTRPDGTLVSSPWDANLNGTGLGGNRPAAYTPLGLNPLKQGWSALLNIRDPQNNKLIVNPNTLLHSSMDALHAPLLVSPPAGVPYYPAVIGATGTTAATAASGFPGGAFGANPFMGLGIKPVLARFLPDWAWALGERAKGFVFQERDPLEVTQENQQSGAAFEVDAYRFKSRRRFEAEWVESRFFFLGDDGSAVGAF